MATSHPKYLINRWITAFGEQRATEYCLHGVVSARFATERVPEYEILHGNDLLGVQPGLLGGKATDHAYVLARLDMR